MLSHVDAEVGLNGAGIVAERALVRLFIGVNAQVGLQRVLELEDFIAVFTREDLKLGGGRSEKQGKWLKRSFIFSSIVI